MKRIDEIFKPEEWRFLPLGAQFLNVIPKDGIIYVNRYVKVKRYESFKCPILPYYKKISTIL